MRRFPLRALVGTAGLALLAPVPVSAQGFTARESSACLMSRAGAGVANPCRDGSAIFTNPAGLMDLESQVLSVGLTLYSPRGSFTSTRTGLAYDLEERAQAVPTAFYGRRFGRAVAAGIGVYQPYRVQTEWPTDFAGRFLEYRSQIRNFNISPTVAVRPAKGVTLGAGLNVSWYTYQHRQRLDLSQFPASPAATWGQLGVAAGTDFADVGVTGDEVRLGFTVSAIVEPVEGVRLGGRYSSRQSVEMSGLGATVRPVPTGLVLTAGNPLGLPGGTPIDPLLQPLFQPGQTFSDQAAATSFSIPDEFVVGLSIALGPRGQVLGEWQRTNWQQFESYDITFERLPAQLGTRPANWFRQDAARFGAEYRVLDAVTARGGYAYLSGVNPDESVDPFYPLADRSQFSLGLGIRASSLLQVDLGWQHVQQGDRAGRVAPGSNTGLYEWQDNRFAATFAFAF